MKDEAHVQVFGEEINPRRRHWHSGRIIWGVLILFAGIIFLLNNLNIVPWTFWDYVWSFWPMLLILWGFHIILGNNPVSSFIIFLLTLAVVGAVFLYGLAQVGSPLVNYFPPDVNKAIIFVEQLRQSTR